MEEKGRRAKEERIGNGLRDTGGSASSFFPAFRFRIWEFRALDLFRISSFGGVIFVSRPSFVLHSSLTPAVLKVR